MSLPPLLPILAPLAIPVAEQVTQRLADGLSFAQTLLQTAAGSQARRENPAGTAVEIPRSGGLAALPASHHQPHRLAQRQLELFTDQLQTFLAAGSIDTAQPIELKSDGRGGVILASDHPDRVAIERHFEANPELAAAFHRLAAAYSLAARSQASAGERILGEFRLLAQADQVRVRFE